MTTVGDPTHTSSKVAAGITLPGVPPGIDTGEVIDQMVRRASSLGFPAWWRRAESAGFCARPIQLVGTDGQGREQVVWTRCNNRRASVCPSCSDLYARDTWHLVHAGTAGGHHQVPTDVADHPQVFTTLTAPGFGPVHHHTGTTCRNPRGAGGRTRCPHGAPLSCPEIHHHADAVVGAPLCRRCYDYRGHVLFTWHLPELWRRFTIALRRALAATLKAAGRAPDAVRVSFVKVVEMQARAIPHIHALIRLDPSTTDPLHDTTTSASTGHRVAREGHGPATARGGGGTRSARRDGWVSPITATDLAALIHRAARTTTVTAVVCDDEATERRSVVRFGPQIDTQPLTHAHPADASITAEAGAVRLSPHRVAGYLAKYVTKSLQDFGISARRLSAEAITDLDVTDHVRAILATIATLADAGIRDLGRWLHTLGYRGHITTKSRAYSTTMGALRAHRATWTRQQRSNPAASQHDPNDTVTDGADLAGWEFDRAGHACLGDRTLATSAAVQAIAARRAARENHRDTPHVDHPRWWPDD